MHTRPRLLAGVVATLSLLAALLPGLTSTAYAGERAAPSAVEATAGYRQVTVSFLPAGGQATYEVLLGETWTNLATTPAAGSRLQGTVTGLGDGELFTPRVRADYGNGSFSQPASGWMVRTLGKPGTSYGGELYATARTISYWRPPAEESVPDGVRITADPVKRGLPTRSDTCAPNDGCKPLVTGLRKGQRYLVTVEAFNQAKQDGEVYRLFAAPTPPYPMVATDGPQAPLDLGAEPRDRSVLLRWYQPSITQGVAVTTFQVKVGKKWRALTTSSEGGLLSAEVGNLVNGRSYTFAVRGRAPGTGKPGVPATVTVTPGVLS